MLPQRIKAGVDWRGAVSLQRAVCQLCAGSLLLLFQLLQFTSGHRQELVAAPLPSLQPAAEMWPCAPSSCVALQDSLSLLQLHHPMEMLSYLHHCVVFYCAIAVLWSRMWVMITALWGMGSSWDVISYCNVLPRGQYACKSHKCFPAALLAFRYHFGCQDLRKHRLLHF